MTKLNKARIQRLDPQTGQAIEDVDVLTSADCVTLDSGETVENKLSSIEDITIEELDRIINPIIEKKLASRPKA